MPLQLLYIAGESRSGSTLLEMTLGQVAGLWPAGEVRYIWQRGLVGNQLCGCGSTFRDCPIWRSIVTQSLGPAMLSDLSEARRIEALQHAVDQPRSVFRNAFFSPRRYTGAFREHRRQYVDVLGRLYRSIRDVSGTRWVIDSSKAPSHAWLVRGIDDIRMHVVHIVRDCRAVAFSMQRKKVRPEITDEKTFMPTYPAWRTALRWTLINKVCHNFERELAARNGDAQPHTGYTFVRYEDFIRQPLQTVSRILRDIGMGDAALDHIHGETVHLKSNHTVAGNPIRFRTGEVKLALDDQWRQALPGMSRRVVQTLARGGLRRYAYLPDERSRTAT